MIAGRLSSPALAAARKYRVSTFDARDRFSDEVRKQTGVHMPVYPEKCPVCGLDIVYDAGDEG